MAQVDWTPVNSQSDLEALDRAICWEDSNVLEAYTTHAVAPGLPTDVSRSGYGHGNLYVLMNETCNKRGVVELAFLEVNQLGANALTHLHLRGRIDSLKRVEVLTCRGEFLLPCARVAFRYPGWMPFRQGYYQRSWSADEDRLE
ncbi:MAG: hypothetical protein JST54_01030 [Deltaproteobacteria bacterium]|nr:hypothetical protein [Deltaproteobacteria bacterium]